jgi:hypothetical protein
MTPGEAAYVDKMRSDPEWVEDIDGTITSAIYYASPAVSITMSTTEWDAVLVLMRHGKKALGITANGQGLAPAASTPTGEKRK